jgi:sulfide:quinone oxidoreductase
MSQSMNGAGGASRHDIVIVGGGAAGIGVAASLLKRRASLKIAIVEPRDVHFYQPGWTMVGAGIFSFESTKRAEERLIPKGVAWVRAACTGFSPDTNEIVLDDGRRVGYSVLIAAPGLKLDWAKIPGLSEALGKNGVASNYKEGLAPYTWELVRAMKKGTAIFTMAPMPIKCAGAPQKALYLSCDHWRRQGVLKDIEIWFSNANAALFGVADYVPALMEYIKAYGVRLELGENLVAVDGAAKTATFEKKAADGTASRITRRYDFLHACPPQTALDFVKASPLANSAGWIDVDQDTLQSVKYPNVFALGDAASTANAKTAAAVRKQAPIVAANTLAVLDKTALPAKYTGYGSCPLTVERGKIVFAEFGYGGKLQPTFPSWFIDGLKPTRNAWFLKEKVLPWVYWDCLLKGREWLTESR